MYIGAQRTIGSTAYHDIRYSSRLLAGSSLMCTVFLYRVCLLKRDF
jgi:hypothetical protein